MCAVLSACRRSFNVCTTNALDRLLFDTLIIQTSPTRKNTIKKDIKIMKKNPAKVQTCAEFRKKQAGFIQSQVST
jgi:hypothetical protein